MEAREKSLGGAPYGLIGRRLGHSWSPRIHERLGSRPYTLLELEPEEVEPFLRGGAWRGLNVTIPYKLDAARIADVRSEAVAALGAANTLVRGGDGSIVAENTDVLGFSWMLTRFCRERLGRSPREALEGREVLVLGSGGAGRAVRYALETFAGAKVSVISRSGEDGYEGLAARHPNTILVVNTTPVGMYPNCPDSPLDEGTLSSLEHLAGVLDVVYNPVRTGLVLLADRLGIPSESGLAMLVAQALYASELFQGTTLDDALVESIEHDILSQTENVVLIGMPGAGKSSCGRELAALLGRPFVDLDDALELECGRSARQVIEQDGERAFRALESEVVRRHGARSGLVVACGGGVVTQPQNYAPLRQNGRIVFLDRPLDELSSDGRPVSRARGVERLAAERMALYRAWADVTLRCTGSPEGDAEALRTALGI